MDAPKCAKCRTTETVGLCRECGYYLCDECAWKDAGHKQHMAPYRFVGEKLVK